MGRSEKAYLWNVLRIKWTTKPYRRIDHLIKVLLIQLIETILASSTLHCRMSLTIEANDDWDENAQKKLNCFRCITQNDVDRHESRVSLVRLQALRHRIHLYSASNLGFTQRLTRATISTHLKLRQILFIDTGRLIWLDLIEFYWWQRSAKINDSDCSSGRLYCLKKVGMGEYGGRLTRIERKEEEFKSISAIPFWSWNRNELELQKMCICVSFLACVSHRQGSSVHPGTEMNNGESICGDWKMANESGSQVAPVTVCSPIATKVGNWREMWYFVPQKTASNLAKRRNLERNQSRFAHAWACALCSRGHYSNGATRSLIAHSAIPNIYLPICCFCFGFGSCVRCYGL